MTNELKQIVKDIEYFTDKKMRVIAKNIGYTRAYFNDQVNKGKNDNLLSILKEKYGKEIKQGVRNSPLFKEMLKEEMQQVKENLSKLSEDIGQPVGLHKEQVSSSSSSLGKKEALTYLRKDKPKGKTLKRSR